MESDDIDSCIMDSESFNEQPECTDENMDESETLEPIPDEAETDAEFEIEPQECSSLSSEEESCEVALTVSIALAIPNAARDDDSVTVNVNDTDKTKKKQKKVICPNTVVEAPKAQGYYHIEYNLLPHDPEPTKVDLVMFGLAAKLYKGNRAKVLKPWVEDDKTWLTWSQVVRLKATKDMLIKLLRHKVTFRVWDTKDHVSATAKHDRPKAFRLPTDKSDSPELFNCRKMVLRMRNNYGKEGCKGRAQTRKQSVVPTDMRTFPDITKVEPKLSNADMSAHEKQSSATAIIQPADQGRDQDSPTAELRWPQESDRSSSRVSGPRERDRATSNMCFSKKFHQRRHTAITRTSLAHTLAHTDYVKKNGVASAELSFIYLLAGEMSLTGSMASRSRGVLQGMCNLSLDRPLISGEMKTALNPLVITIHSATHLPSTPVSLHELEDNCEPVYCRYKFHNMKPHRTKGYEHSSSIYFKDVNVIFAGLIRPGELVEYLQGPPLQIEVHDRDMHGDRTLPKSFDVFGRTPQDGFMSSVAQISSKAITHNPFESAKPQHPHGVARLSFAELLNGQRFLRYNLPICGSPSVQFLGRDKTLFERKMLDPRNNSSNSDYGDASDVMPVGHYLQSNSHLKVQVEIACPLNTATTTEAECPFSRIVFIMKNDDGNGEALTRLRAEIVRVNSAALQVKSKIEEVKQRALTFRKVSTEEVESRKLDFLTGFHLLDKNMHLFVIEGLRAGAVKGLWNMPLAKSDGVDKPQITIMYNSALGFSKRLYDCLDVGFCPIHLHEPLQDIMRRPLLYVRDMVPHLCFQGLSRLTQLCQTKTMKEVLRNDLLPTADMVLSISKEFGSLPEKAQKVLKEIVRSATGEQEKSKVRVQRSFSPLVNHNKEYEERLKLVAAQKLRGDTKNFVQANRDEVRRASLELNRPKTVVVVAEVPEGKTAHNYSSQALNSTEQAKKLLRKELAKAPSQRYTYSQEFLSAMFEPFDVESERKASQAMSSQARPSPMGFSFPGFSSSIECNEHPKMPDEPRIEELRKPWRENILHGNTLRPTLSRTRWPWEWRSEDFELYSRPPPVFQPKPPVTIHLSGDLLVQEQQEAAQAQYTRWLEKILPGRHSPDSHKIPSFKAHMKKDGLDKLSPILKDKPRKITLIKRRTFWETPTSVSPPHLSEVANRERQKRVQLALHQSDPEENTSSHSAGQFKNDKPFRGYWRAHSFRHKRTPLPLKEGELDVFRFQSRREPAATMPRLKAHAGPTVGHIIETSTHASVVLHVH
ncbi:uncharacterized protein cfap92 [Engraulis encrasicolus]|uniref:uncharacterized protein cfap92 n=1 Tax=Engraulis encrasicolus TaxID=184585 RepID=UPI002FD0D205